MPEGSELYGLNSDVSIVWTRAGWTTTAAEAGDADQRSTPNAVAAAADTNRTAFLRGRSPNVLRMRPSPFLRAGAPTALRGHRQARRPPEMRASDSKRAESTPRACVEAGRGPHRIV